MKKLSIIMSAILAALFFLMVFFSMGNENFKNVMDVNSYFKTVDIAKEKGIQVFVNETRAEDKEFQRYLYTIFEKYQVTAIGITQYWGTELQSDICYVYSNKDIYKNQFFTKDDKRIDLSSASEQQYYTVNKKAKNGVLIEFLNPMYYNFTTPYEIHPFYQAIDQRMPVLLNIVGIDEETFLKEIANSSFSDGYIARTSYLSDELIAYAISNEGIQFNPEKLMYICITLAFVSLLTLVIVEVIRNKKHIAVAKLNGIGKIRIISKIFLPFLSYIFLAYMVTSLALLYLTCGGYREVNKDLYHIMLLTILMFFIVNLLLILFLYGYLWVNVNFHDLKKNKINSFSIYLNIVVKVMMTSVLILPFTSLSIDAYEQMKETVVMYQMRNENKNRYIVSVFDNNIGELSNTYELIGNAYGGKAYNIMNWIVNKDMNEKFNDQSENYKVPLIVVNRNYLKDYDKLYAYETGEEIILEQLHDGVLLVPKSHAESISLENYKEQLEHQKVIITKDMKKTLKPLRYGEAPYASKYAKNPIIYVIDEANQETLSWATLYVDQTDLSNLSKELKEKSLDKNVSLESLLPAVDLDYNKHMITFTTMAFMMIGYLVVYLSFVYQSIYVYLDVHRKKISVQYLQGYSYPKRYYEIYIMNACAYILAGCGAVFLFNTSIKDVVIYILFFGLIEMLFEAYQIRRFERTSSLRSLK